MTTLYKLNSNNEISWWTCEVRQNDLIISWGKSLPIVENNNTVTYTFTTPEEAEKDFNRRVNKQIDRKGYSYKIPYKQPDLPMLAQEINWGKLPDWEGFSLQPKLDGVRAISSQGKLWTRANVEIKSCPHIDFLVNTLPFDVKLDGELIIKNTPLKDISGIARRGRYDSMTALLEYHVFDLVDTEMSFLDRMHKLEEVVHELKKQHLQFIKDAHPYTKREYFPLKFPIKVVPTVYYDQKVSEDVIKQHFSDCLANGYEGSMLRSSRAPYEINTRSKYLIKVKPFTDAEFRIIEISKDKKGRAILHVESADGVSCTCSYSGTDTQQRQIADNPWLFVGKVVTIQSEGYHPDSRKPRGPKAIKIHDSVFEGRTPSKIKRM